MIIKKFQGKTIDDAMNKAKAELGEDIVLMSQKTGVKAKGLFGFLKPKLTEVTIAKEEEDDRNIRNYSKDIKDTIATVDRLRAESNPGDEKTGELKAINKNIENDDSEINKRLDSIQSLLEEKLKKTTNDNINGVSSLGESSAPEKQELPESDLKKDSNKEKTVSNNSDSSNSDIKSDEKENLSSKTNDKELIEFIGLLRSTMINNEVDSEYADMFIDELKQSINENANMEYLLSLIYQKMILKFGKPLLITPCEKKGPKVIFFIGPTGVGKTTTLAKLASQLYLVDKKSVAFVTTDTYRIAASNQLETYANILSTPFSVVYTHEDMLECFEKYSDFDYILVDTAGHSHNNKEQKEEMNSFIHLLDDKAEKEVYLVLSATTKYRDLLAIADTYSELTDYRMIFTKLDETSTYGNILNLRIHTGKSLSYVTCGQNVPDDIDRFDPQETVRQLLSGNE